MSLLFVRPLSRAGYYAWRMHPNQLTACRHLQTFGQKKEGSHSDSYFSKKLQSSRTHLLIYFTLATPILFYVFKLSWDHNQSTKPPSASVMTMDQLEMISKIVGGKKAPDREKPVDAKGLEEMMENLYEEHMSGAVDYENIRGPRPEEPETILLNEAAKVAKLTAKSKKSITAFTESDYSKIKPDDIVLDMGEEE